MLIPESAWPDYERNGDTLGACNVEEVCNLLMPVAPEIEKKATEEAQVVVATQESVTEQVAVIEAPKTQEKVVDQIDICRAIPDYRSANFDSASSDTDSDGLSWTAPNATRNPAPSIPIPMAMDVPTATS